MSEKVFGTKKQGSIKDIPLPEESRNRGSTLNLGSRADAQNSPRKGGGAPAAWSRKNGNKGRGLKISILVVGLLLAGLAYSYLFHSATIVVEEKQETATLAQEEFTASLAASSSDALGFVRVDPFTQTESLYVEGSVEENRQTKASGLVTVYNTDSTEKNYIKNTRFKTEDGLVYRAFSRFTIPSGTVDNPGTTEILVVAENPGSEYNSEEGASYKLPALKEQGDPSYDFVYAEQAEPIEGGYSGIVRVPLEEDVREAETKLETRLNDDLFAKFKETLPAGKYVVDRAFVRVEEPSFTQSPNEEKGGVDLVARTRLFAVVFKKDAFEKFMATQVLDKPGILDPIIIENIDDLNFSITSDSFDPEVDQEVSFSVVGEAQFVWEVQEEEVKEAIAGKLKSHIMNNLVTDLSGIPVEEVNISPFWRRSVPSDTDSITVIVE